MRHIVCLGLLTLFAGSAAGEDPAPLVTRAYDLSFLEGGNAVPTTAALGQIGRAHV